MAELAEVTEQSFEAEVIRSDKPVIVDFWAEWCAPCRAIAPIMKELGDSYGDQVKIVKMNVDECPQTPGRYNVRAIPTVIAFQNGQVAGSLQGARPKSAFEEMLKKLL
jgi:thioredoxin 1